MAEHYQFTKTPVDVARLTLEIQQSSIPVALDHVSAIGDELTIYFKNDLTVEQETLLGSLVASHTGEPLPGAATMVEITGTPEFRPPSDLVLPWSTLKAAFLANDKLALMNFIDMGDSYYVWLEIRNQMVYAPAILKGTADATDFETSFKARCNTLEAERTRITTNKLGRRLHDRYVTLVTASQGNFDNTDYLDVSFGDVQYSMIDQDRAITTNNAAAKETWIDFEPPFSYEVCGGTIFVPPSLGGGNDDAWELHVVAAPDYPPQVGGSVIFIANPRIKWIKGSPLGLDASLNPAEMTFVPGQHLNKIRFIFKHPVGAQTEFQINLKIFK